MTELSLHILDIVQNSIAAGARSIHITIVDDRQRNFWSAEIIDNGPGMSPGEVQMATDPFYTSRSTRNVGLGLPLFKQAAEQCNGTFSIQSEKGSGTRVLATFELGHIDRQPLGDMAGVLGLLTGANPDIDFSYEHITNRGKYRFDSSEARQILEGIPVSDPKVIRFLKEMIRENLKEIDSTD